jgi:CheY-like chemotaxis protein
LLAIEDTGEGIAPDDLPHIFEAFRQATEPRAGGLGLGLDLVRRLTELHGGSVRVRSEGFGRGATFTVDLPLAPATMATSHAGVRPAGRLDHRAVLVVEDDDDTRVMLTKTLERHGASVTAVASAPAALDALRTRRPHVVVSDIAMPGEDGCSLLVKIRNGAVESCRDVPAIALTAFARPDDRDRILAAGFLDQLTKPVDAAVMLRTVSVFAAR